MYAKGVFVSRDSDKAGPEYQQKLKIERWFDENHIQWAGNTRGAGTNIFGLRHAAQIAGLGIIRGKGVWQKGKVKTTKAVQEANETDKDI